MAPNLVGCLIKIIKFELVVFCYYSAPNASLKDFKLSMDCIRSVCHSDFTYLLLGDFNQPSIDWCLPFGACIGKTLELVNLCTDLGLEQINHFATRGNNILDLVFTNDALIISKCCVSHPFANSDHSSLILSIFTPIMQDNVSDFENVYFN